MNPGIEHSNPCRRAAGLAARIRQGVRIAALILILAGLLPGAQGAGTFQNPVVPVFSRDPGIRREPASENIGGFTGVFIGLCATGNGQTNRGPADFDWFEYRTLKSK